MAAKRYRHGLYGYSPKRNLAAKYRKQAPGPKQTAKLEARAKRAGRLPSPSSAAGKARARALLPQTEEVRFLKRAALEEALHGGDEYSRELREKEQAHYRKLYAERQAERRRARARGVIKGRKPRPKSAIVRVRAYTRRRPHHR